MGAAHRLPGDVQPHHKVEQFLGDHRYVHPYVCLNFRMVESELFPALRYFGLRFYAYNPVSQQHCSCTHVTLPMVLYSSLQVGCSLGDIPA